MKGTLNELCIPYPFNKLARGYDYGDFAKAGGKILVLAENVEVAKAKNERVAGALCEGKTVDEILDPMSRTT